MPRIKSFQSSEKALAQKKRKSSKKVLSTKQKQQKKPVPTPVSTQLSSQQPPRSDWQSMLLSKPGGSMQAAKLDSQCRAFITQWQIPKMLVVSIVLQATAARYLFNSIQQHPRLPAEKKEALLKGLAYIINKVHAETTPTQQLESFVSHIKKPTHTLQKHTTPPTVKTAFLLNESENIDAWLDSL